MTHEDERDLALTSEGGKTVRGAVSRFARFGTLRGIVLSTLRRTSGLAAAAAAVDVPAHGGDGDDDGGASTAPLVSVEDTWMSTIGAALHTFRQSGGVRRVRELFASYEECCPIDPGVDPFELKPV